MKLNTYVQQSSNLFARNRLLQFVVIVLAACLMFTSFMAYRAVRYQKVILIPPQMTGTVEFVQGKPTEAYIQDIGRRIISLATTYSPSTARKQFNELLVYYAPESYPEASTLWYSLAGRIEITETPSVPKVANTTAIVPSPRRPMAICRSVISLLVRSSGLFTTLMIRAVRAASLPITLARSAMPLVR